MSYTIMIDESQRRALIEVLKRHESELDKVGVEHALDYWIEMLEDLPALETEHPGIMHGFCL